MTDPRPPVPGFAGRMLAGVYGYAVARRNRRYDRGRGVVTLDRPVISVGNLSVGGTGKTPMVAHLVRVLLGAGRHPCIAMRGYGSSRDLDGMSDEAALYRDEFRAVPVVARPDRVEGLLGLFATPGGEPVDCVVLDDGFQHRRLARQLDIVMVDATRDPRRDRLLPAGRLREPVASLARARWVVLSHAQAVDPADAYSLGVGLRAVNPSLRVAITRHVWKELFIHTPGGVECAGHEWLAGKRVLAVCALGNPEPFLAQVRRAAGASSVETVTLRDHDPYRESATRRILEAARGCDAVVTTAKDWTKLSRVPASSWPCPVARPHLEVSFDAGREDLERDVIAAASTPPP